MRYSDGEIVVREGDYGNSAFLIFEGTVFVVLDGMDTETLGRQRSEQKSFFQSFSQLWSNSSLAEFRDVTNLGKSAGTNIRGEGANTRVFLQDVPVLMEKHQTVILEEGTMFGEIAALGRTPRTATVVARGDCVLLEIRWQGLRDIRRRDEELRNYVDRLYRERSLMVQLMATPAFSNLSEEDFKIVADNTLFETYGEFDWHSSYKAMEKKSASDRFEFEPLIAEEGNYADGLIMIRAGFARVTERVDFGQRTISYIGKGGVFGFDEIAHNFRFEDKVPLQSSLRALGYIDILRVPTAIIEKYVLPNFPESMYPPRIVPRGTDQSAWKGDASRQEIATGFMEFLVDNRYINGTATMIIDMERCTRCDDCVRACASTHDNNPRFIRHGKRFQNFIVANACMHCVDPVCMIGCPTGAIHRESHKGQVVINDATCIGCATCANSCPYDNIRMTAIRDNNGAFILAQSTHVPVMKATKCDLCVDQLGGPACVRACPHDALKRVDMRDTDKLAKWINR
jgi:Fe-S-cluster-containing dehydrogenase component/CRP-like cAMP-binding protein